METYHFFICSISKTWNL